MRQALGGRSETGLVFDGVEFGDPIECDLGDRRFRRFPDVEYFSTTMRLMKANSVTLVPHWTASIPAWATLNPTQIEFVSMSEFTRNSRSRTGRSKRGGMRG